MRTFKPLALGFLFVFCTLPAHAQAQSQPDRTPRILFSWNVGGQSREQSFTDSSTFDIYGEKGALATAQSIGGGTLFDVGLATRVWKGFGVGFAYSTVKNKNDASATVRVPHPVIFGQSRTATATVADLEHSENVIHLQFMWTIPVLPKLEITAMVGPSFYTVRQTIASVRVPQNISDPAPFNNVSITSVNLTDVKDSPTGVNIGLDATYVVTTIKNVGIGVGGFVRYSGASLDFPVDTGVTRDGDLKAGGSQGGVGLRLRY